VPMERKNYRSVEDGTLHELYAWGGPRRMKKEADSGWSPKCVMVCALSVAPVGIDLTISVCRWYADVTATASI
jgi:hypothetical protein